MSVESDLMTTLAPTGLYVARDRYTGSAASYIVIDYSTEPHLFSNDEPQSERYRIRVRVIAPATTDTTALRAQIKTLLRDAGYDFPRMVDASDDPKQQRIVFETGVLE